MSELINNFRPSYKLADIERGVRLKRFLRSRAMNGDNNAIHTIADAELCIHQANLTETQHRSIALVWEQQRILKDAGEIMGISPQGVRFNLQLATVKIKKILNDWQELEEAEVYRNRVRERIKTDGERV